MFSNYVKLALVLFLLFITSKNSQSKIINTKTEKDKVYKGSFEGGLTIEGGNTQTESYYAKFNYDHNFKNKWKNIIYAFGENKLENKVRTKEEYRINNQTKYSLSKLNYSLIDIEYTDDRFGGFDHRLSETFGFGRNLVKNDLVTLSVQISGGLVQSSLTEGRKEDGWLAKTSSNFSWEINKNMSFNQNLSFSIDKETSITRSDGDLKIIINSSLYLKLNLLIENKSNVPEEYKNTDRRFMAIIGYEF